MESTPLLHDAGGVVGVKASIRRDLWERCAHTCEACGLWLERSDMHAHHRKLRSQGGLDELANLLAVHHACHRSLHLYPERSYELGHLVRSYHDPGDVPVVLYPPMGARGAA